MKLLRRKKAEPGLEAASEHIELKPEERFLAEIEKLMMAEREKKQEASQSKEKKQKDGADSFVEDVEKRLSSNKGQDED